MHRDDVFEVEWSDTGVIERMTRDEALHNLKGDDEWVLRPLATEDGPNGPRERGRDWATCGHCGRTWDDGHVSQITPTPSGRCPFEYDHEYDD